MAIFNKKGLDKSTKLLIESETRFQDIFDRSAVGESIVSLTGQWLEVNDRLCKMTGYSKKELLDKNFTDITYPEDIAKSRKAREDITSGKSDHVALEKRYICKDGSIIWVLLSISLYLNHDNKPHYFIVNTQDITEFKKTEQSLLDSEKNYNSIIEGVNDGILIIQNFLTKFANKKLLELTGYTMKEISDRPFIHFVAPEFVETAKENYEKSIGGYNFDKKYQLNIIKKDGTELPVEVSGSVINYSGKPAVMIFMADITERNKKEEEFKKFKFIIEQSPEEVAIADFDKNLTYVNESAARNHGYKKEELIGRKVSVLHPKEELPKIENDLKKLLKDGKSSYEVKQLRKDGSEYETIMNNFILDFNNNNNNNKYFVGMSIDMSDLRAKETEILEQRSLLDSIIKSTNDALLVIDSAGKVTFYNDKFKSLWNIPESIIKTKDDKKLLDYVVGQLASPKEFLDKVAYLYANPEREDYDTIKFKDERVFSRFSMPQRVGKDIIGRIWSFNDITQKILADKKEKERINQIERINKITVGRELKMIELKKEIAELKNKIQK